MNEIKVAENKTLKLTNVLSREIRPEEMASLPVVLTQMHNFIKSNNAQPIGPIIQSFALGEDHQMHLYMMQQATQLIPQMDPGYHMDAILRVKNCLYAHYTGPMENSQLASYKLHAPLTTRSLPSCRTTPALPPMAVLCPRPTGAR